jgi:hypothetical protein
MFEHLQKLVSEPHQTSELPAITDFSSIAVAAGNFLYAFEGQTLV